MYTELAQIYIQGYEFVAETPLYKNAKTTLLLERGKVLRTIQNPAGRLDQSEGIYIITPKFFVFDGSFVLPTEDEIWFLYFISSD